MRKPTRRHGTPIEAIERRLLLSTTIYVDANASSPTHDGTSWPTAFTDLQQALAIAAPGDEIHVADGVYKPTSGTDRTATFALKNSVRLLGGYAGDDSPDPDARDIRLYESILSGEIGDTATVEDNSFHVVSARNSVTFSALTGFTITGGNAAGNISSGNADGGGLYCVASGATISDCRFIRNIAGRGGAFFAGATQTFTNCFFAGNKASLGGAMWCGLDLNLVNCVFVGNVASTTGGAVYLHDTTVVATNCTFTSNLADVAGGPFYADMSVTTLTNCILWDDHATVGSENYDSDTITRPPVTYCDVSGGWEGAGNISVDPAFYRIPTPGSDAKWGTADDDYGDLRLKSASLVADAGNNSAVPAGVLLDAAGGPRFQDIPATADTGVGPAPIVDMGAYEATNDLSVTAGGLYVPVEGASVTLHGRAVSDINGPLTYAWDLDGDGKFDDATGTDVNFSTAGLPVGTVLEISVRATDSASRNVLDTTSLTVKPAVLYVDSRARGTSDGTTWSKALADLSDAIDLAVPGTTIRVAQGTYKPYTWFPDNGTFELRNRIILRGGYAGQGAVDPDARDLNLYPTHLGERFTHVQTLVTVSRTDSSTVLDGFIISDAPYAVYIDKGGPMVANCTFIGSGIGCVGAPAPSIVGCKFVRAGIGCTNSSPSITSCVFIGNGNPVLSVSGSPRLSNCTFTELSTSLLIHSASSSSVTLTNCIVWGNGQPTPQLTDAGTAAVTYSDIEGGFPGLGNINLDPLFERKPSAGPDGTWATGDDDLGDLTPRACSPVVDAGNNAAVPSNALTEAAGRNRFIDVFGVDDTGVGTAPVVDMGAYEAAPALTIDSGGPYAVIAGQSITLAGRGSTDVNGPLNFEWDWDGDGQFDDASGAHPVFSTTTGEAGTTFPIALRITDILGRSQTALTTLTVLPLIIYVDAKATGAHNGTSWANAYTSLVDALDVARPGVALRIAAGTYTPANGTDRAAAFAMKSGIAMYGGFAGLGSANPDARDPVNHPTILSGEIGSPNTTSDNSSRIVICSDNDATAILDGFTITAANGTTGAIYITRSTATIANCTVTGNLESGLYVSLASPTVRACIITANITGTTATTGAMHNLNSAPIVTDCIFSANSGSGMYNSLSSPFVTSCSFSANMFGGMYNTASSPTLLRCTFARNNLSGMANYAASNSKLYDCAFTENRNTSGGGMFNQNSSPWLTRCVFLRNSADQEGGGFFSERRSAMAIPSPTLLNCTFEGNTSSANGGGMADFTAATVMNCIFVGNYAGNYGGGMDAFGSDGVISNCTFVGNIADYEAGGVFLGTLYNCVVWKNSAYTLPELGYSTATYCDVRGGFEGTGNIDADPLFVRLPSPGNDAQWGTADDDFGDLHTAFFSPIVDSGDSSAVPDITTKDFDGNPRMIDVPTTPDAITGALPAVDMGAFETPSALRGDAGGQYYVVAGRSLTLNAHGASDVFGDLSFAWEWTGDGKFDDATGPNPEFTTVGLKAGAKRQLLLRVTDADGKSTFSSASVIVTDPVLYVDARAVGSSDGTSWLNAVPDLADAIARATPGQVIKVAQGVYKPATCWDLVASFPLRNEVQIFGGFAGVGAIVPDARDIVRYPTILSGDYGTRGIYPDKSNHVVDASLTDATAVLDGVTITGGNASYATAGSSLAAGGGLFAESGSPTLINCVFRENSSSYRGGGMYVFYGSNPTLLNCKFIRNTAARDYGGGLCLVYQCNATVIGCEFDGNSADYAGAGLWVHHSTPKIVNCAFVGNTASYRSALNATAVYGSSINVDIVNCTFTANRATKTAGGAVGGEGSAFLRLSNCILWSNENGGAGTGTDPEFVRAPSKGADGIWGTADDDYGDLRLRIDSPCIDAGDNSAVPSGITADIAGNPRFIDIPGVHDPGAIVDMGAYERIAPIADAGYLFDAVRPTVSVKFGFDALASSISASDFLLTNLTTGQTLDCGLISSVSYDPLTHTASWVFNAALPDGNYRAILPVNSVSDDTGSPALGANLTLGFFVLGGDANRDRIVDVNDLSILTRNWNGSGKAFSQGDFNYDGKVDAKDLGILSSHWQQTLPPPVPTAPVRAPTRTPARVATLVL